jgi:hypothetical protein
MAVTDGTHIAQFQDPTQRPYTKIFAATKAKAALGAPLQGRPISTTTPIIRSHTAHVSLISVA